MDKSLVSCWPVPRGLLQVKRFLAHGTVVVVVVLVVVVVVVEVVVVVVAVAA